MRLKCPFADRYKARRAPKCGCAMCWFKWQDHQIEILRGRLEYVIEPRIESLEHTRSEAREGWI